MAPTRSSFARRQSQAGITILLISSYGPDGNVNGILSECKTLSVAAVMIVGSTHCNKKPVIGSSSIVQQNVCSRFVGTFDFPSISNDSASFHGAMLRFISDRLDESLSEVWDLVAIYSSTIDSKDKERVVVVHVLVFGFLGLPGISSLRAT